MKTFFPDEQTKNEAAEQPWKKSETDRMLDLYLSGSHPKEIAYKLSRNPKAVKRRIEQFTYNERERADRYEPFRRVGRKGKRLTQNEMVIIAAHKERGVAASVTAKVLMREVDEIKPDIKGKASVKEGRVVASSLDLVLAHQYIREAYKTEAPIISDKTYEDMVAEEIEFGGGAGVLTRAFNQSLTPHHIKSLALYLLQKKLYEEGP